MHRERIGENMVLATEALNSYLETSDLAALARVRAFLDLASKSTLLQIGVEEEALRAAEPKAPIQYPEEGKTRRCAFAVARDFGLKTDKREAMLAAINGYLNREFTSRKELSEHDWIRVISGIEHLELSW